MPLKKLACRFGIHNLKKIGELVEDDIVVYDCTWATYHDVLKCQVCDKLFIRELT